MRYICCVVFAFLIVMLFNFVLARYRSRVAKTESAEILESAMSYYTHSEPKVSEVSQGYNSERFERKGD